MSNRTKALPPLSGLPHVVRELRYHEASRQILGLVLTIYFAVIAQPVEWLFYAAAVIVVLGLAVRLWASGFIMKNKELATNGPYALVRHPLYVGNILILIAFSAASGLWWTALIVVAFLWFYYPTAIEYEDRKLHKIFEDAWQVFADQTPALLPNFGGRTRDISGQWSFKKSMMANLEPVIVVFLLGLFVYIYNKM
jgi:protein-S-isoprenylcysteine O-methyltransferase Ste14